MNFRTPEIEHAVGERSKMRVRKRGSADEFPDPGNRAIKGVCLVRGYPRLSEGYPRLSHDYRNSPCFFLMFESFVVPEMSFPDQSTGLEFSLSADNFRSRKSQHDLRYR